MKITRRELMASAAALTAVPVIAQQAAVNTDALNKVQIPGDTEPAFAFKA